MITALSLSIETPSSVGTGCHARDRDPPQPPPLVPCSTAGRGQRALEARHRRAIREQRDDHRHLEPEDPRRKEGVEVGREHRDSNQQ
jgi:hypothetical protein